MLRHYLILLSRCTVIVLCLLMAACGSQNSPQHDITQTQTDGAPLQDIDVSNIPNAVPKNEPRSRYGNPHSYSVFGKTYYVASSSKNYQERGVASWYGTKFHKQRTSSGEPYDMMAMTAANKTLPLPTYAKVENLENGREVIVKVNDRGPFHENRIIDLSYAAAKKLGITEKGTGLVQVTAIDPDVYHGRIPTGVSQEKVDHTPRIFLQAGAFSQRSYAENMQQSLAKLISDPIQIKSVDDDSLFRVQIGPIANVDDTDALIRKLENSGYSKPITLIE